MANEPSIQTTDLNAAFQALRNSDPSKVSKQNIPNHPDYKRIPSQNYGPIASVNTGNWGNGSAITRTAQSITYGQPQFFSPIHTAINWQLPSKLLEINQWCLTPWNRILCENYTYKAIKDITINDKVLCEDSTFRQVDKIGIREVDEDIYQLEIQSERDSLEITGNHKIFCVKSEDVACKYKLDRPSPQKCTPLFGTPCATYKDKPHKCEKTELNIQKIPVADIKENDYVLFPIPQEIIHNEEINENRARLLGYYTAEGCCTLRPDKSIYQIQWTLNADEIDTLGKEICDLFEIEFGKRPRLRIKPKTPNTLHVLVQSREGLAFFKKYCPGLAPTKVLEQSILTLDPNLQKHIAACYISGDGHFKYRDDKLVEVSFCSASEKLLEQFRIMLARCNISTTGIWTTNNTILYKGEKRNFLCYTCAFSYSSLMNLGSIFIDKVVGEKKYNPKNQTMICQGYILKRITKITKKHYQGPVYNLEVNTIHSYVANGLLVCNCRFFYSNEPKVAAAVDFYSMFPMNDYTHECKDRKVKLHFDALKKRLDLNKWTRLIAHELIMLGNCFAFLEINCEACGGSGKVGDQMCEHEGATIKRLILLNPDNVEVQSTPMNPDPLISLKPNEELMTMVQKKMPGYEKLDLNVSKLIAAGRPIRLDNRNIFHLKHGESGYAVHGEGMIRRLFPILSYKTKIMVAQWIIAERLILPIKIVKVGSDERPAGPADIASVQAQLAQTANDPSLTLVTHHNFDLEYYGACYSDDTEVLTENGWKLYKDVSKNYDEKIATYNLDKNTIEYDVPKEYHEYDFNGDMVLFKNEDVDVLVTPNHNMLACTENSDVFEKIQAKQIAESKINYYFKKAIKDNTNEKHLITPENVSNFNYNGKVWCFTVKNGYFVTRRNGKIGIHGNSGKILQISNEFEFISQEINDGLMISNELINGSGPSISGGQAGIEAMVQRLESFRNYISDWVENFIYLPEAKRKGFITHNEDTDQDEYVVPTIKWNKMHLRDQQQDKQFAMQLYEKGLLSAHTMLEIFGYDPDMEVERKRYDSVQMMALGQGQGQQGGAGGGMGGGGGGGLMGDLGGMGGGGGPDMGGAGGGMGGEPGGAPISAPAGGGEAPAVTKATTFTAEVADISQFGGRVLKQKTRDKIQNEQVRTLKQTNQAQAQNASNTTRDEKGRIIFTKPERDLIGRLQQAQKDGIIKYSIVPQFKMQMTDREYLIDFAIPQLKLGIEADGEMFHSNPKQKQHDKERDMKLAQCGWTILRFMDTEIEKKAQQVISTITQAIVKKEEFIKNSNAKIEKKQL